MKPRLLDLVVCPECRGGLKLATGVEDRNGEVLEGTLGCTDCARLYAVRRGIPRLLPDALASDVSDTARAFGWQWQHFVEMHDQYEAQFLDWVHPLLPEFFAGKVVLDAGCGIGRHSYFAAKFGARDVVAMDLSDAVETAQAVLADLPNAHVVQGDILRPPFRHNDASVGTFDFVYSIGVLHHLADPEAGFAALTHLLAPDGTIFGWVYGYENNGVVRHLVDPFRRGVTTRLPPSAMRVIAWPLAVLFHAIVKGVYGPLHDRQLARRLPLSEYLASLRTFGFRQNYNIVFDQLVAPTAHYLKRDEFHGWFDRAGLDGVSLSGRNGNSWRGQGRRPR